MKKLIFLLSCLLIFTCNITNQTQENLNLTEGQKYFLEIALGSEYGNSVPVVKKWTEDIRVALYTPISPTLQQELTRIIAEINHLSTSISITQVQDPLEANVVIFISDADTYGQYEPNARPYLKENLGLFWAYWNGQYAIYKASLYVDQNQDTSCQKHILREELTQLFGLMNDSYTYPESIFYQGWTCITSYSELDKEVIGYILNPEITPGMNRTQIVNLFQEMNARHQN